MNRNRKLSVDTYGPRHVQPHNPKFAATKPKSKLNMHTDATRGGSSDGRAKRDM